MKSDVYQHPLYYEIAYGFVHAPTHVDLMERYISKHGKCAVNCVLDIGCGPASQLREFARRGYRSVGLDCSQPMLNYLAGKAREEQAHVETVCADMRDFVPKEPVDFAYVLLGSIHYVIDRRGLISHLSSVARALNPGGLYLIECISIHAGSPGFWNPITWTMKRGKISVQCTYQAHPLDFTEKIILQTIDLSIDDHERHIHLGNEAAVEIFSPSEFADLVAEHGEFEFLGFFERESTRPLKNPHQDNNALLRRL